jgi:Tfp pilus assembly protein PilX
VLFIVLIVLVVLAIALGVGLGVGLKHRRGQGGSSPRALEMTRLVGS